MSDVSGSFVIDGRVYGWHLNPVSGGWYLDLTTDTIQLQSKPDILVARIALSAYEQGVTYGKQLGRSILQNEFRNLMDCQS